MTRTGAAAITSVSDFHAFLIGVALPACIGLLTAIKVIAARKLGKPETAAIGT